MKKLNSFLKTAGFVLVGSLILSSCMKSSDPYADYTPEREASLISDWLSSLKDDNANIDTTATGLYYVVEKSGSGPTVKDGDTVTVKYIGMLLGGSVFDASEWHTNYSGTSLPYFSADSTMTYIHHSPESADISMIKGWEEGIEALNAGAGAVFLFPSEKAYGPYGYGSIPPYSPLLFYIEVVRINNNQ